MTDYTTAVLPEGMLENIDRLIELSEKKIAALRDLKKLMLVADMLGVPPKQFTGKVRTAVRFERQYSVMHPWKNHDLVIHVDGKERLVLPLTDVPLDFWPADLRGAYEREQERAARHAKMREERRG